MAARLINIISCVIGPTDYMAEWKFGSALRQNEKKMNNVQSKNSARPMAARLINLRDSFLPVLHRNRDERQVERHVVIICPRHCQSEVGSLEYEKVPVKFQHMFTCTLRRRFYWGAGQHVTFLKKEWRHFGKN